MVDFNKRLGGKKLSSKPINPQEIYDNADRASDTGPLRPAQISVLKEWFEERRTAKDLIIKMHTGQGKTLIGLLLLQSRLNETGEPALYVCPNNNLVQQTLAQAERFGIKCTASDKEIPESFIDSEEILVTTVQKVFNGVTKFGLGPHSQSVGAIVMDDCHACIDAIHENLKITLQRDHPGYQPLVALFGPDLREQGSGTFAEIEQGDYRPFLPVPYWAWLTHQDTVANILAKHAKSDAIKFAWPVVKDILAHCNCLISGASIEIEPHLPPLEHFGSYTNAKHRVFMSATVTNDAFLVKGLGLSEEAIVRPLVDKNERWSGEKMVLIPSLINVNLDRESMIRLLAKKREKRRFGVVAITPSFKLAKDWEEAGAKCASTGTIDAIIQDLREGKCDDVIVIANRYDGIDLPDASCRILIIDSKPQGETLTDRWSEICRAESEVTLLKMARSVEQGLGRSVRGEKDFSVIVILGADLVKQLRSKKTRGFFSEQTQTQIKIGLAIAEFAKEDVSSGKQPDEVFIGLMNQCLGRDSGWKDYYEQQMSQITGAPASPAALTIFTAERAAELAFRAHKPDKAMTILQDLIDKEKIKGTESGWYLQEMARYAYAYDKPRSNELQVTAHQRNRYLLRPRQGMVFESISAVGQKRIERMIAWIKEFASADDLLVEIDAILSNLRFGVAADDFEAAFGDLGRALGFVTQRPDKELREGPDNLWALRDDLYWVVECKNQVDAGRKEINKHETGQMNNSCAWFKQHYQGAKSKNMIIIWTKTVGAAAGFNEPVRIMTNKKLDLLVKNVRALFDELKGADLQDLSEVKLQDNIERHDLSVEELVHRYSEDPVLQ
jgi:replicative superfamily II helicase